MYRALVLAFLLLLAGLACATGRAPDSSASDAIVARVGGEAVTLEELDAYIKEDLFERETRGHNPSRTYDLRSRALERLVRERAFERETERRGLDVDSLVEAEAANQTVSDEAVAEFYERNRAKQGGASLERMDASIRELLLKKQAIESILAAVGVETLLGERPRVEVGTHGPSIGPVDAAVAIVEFSDFQCPFCQRALPVLKSVAAKHPEDVRIVYRHLPLDSIHPQARAGAEASVREELARRDS